MENSFYSSSFFDPFDATRPTLNPWLCDLAAGDLKMDTIKTTGRVQLLYWLNPTARATKRDIVETLVRSGQAGDT